MAEALYASFGSEGEHPFILNDLADDASLTKAKHWGVAIWLANRLSGGAAEVLRQSQIEVNGGEIILTINAKLAALDNQSVQRRLSRLGTAIGVEKTKLRTV